ncbi:cupin domain-containing protein [Magnetospirillum aberrantis]|uniref:Cupin domain-containing protein n=1 Tax=Magnetospirillum aberrantis SpK TaxID=908842 RepID=A0A7C9UWM7_9PROT|nr:cupin domain-containing protein [Magnetospirillum aberrantis]NFV80252.1 cupin domain-containing protein [Magnetospirillum aberrantis SpK]
MKKPALDPATVEGRSGSIYPAPFQAAVAGRVKRRLGDALGLSDFGVNLVELAPGAASALRHWHSAEDEFIHVLSGELTLVTDAGEQVLSAGMCAGFPKNSGDGHCLVNRTDVPASYLEIGTRAPDTDRVVYPDVDLLVEPGRRIVHRDGSPY